MQLLNGSLQEAGLDPSNASFYSLCFTGSVSKPVAREKLFDELKNYDLVVALGAEAMHLLCDTTKTLDKYAGSLTWNPTLETWVLPSHHPSVVYVGPKDTLNTRYDKFDYLFDHLHRAVSLIHGETQFPPTGGHQVPWEFIGHNGKRDPETKLWSGYEEATEDEKERAHEILNGWMTQLEKGVKLFSTDTESWDTNFFNPMLMAQIYDGKKAYAFNWGVIRALWGRFQALFNHKNGRWVLHNTKYDRQVFRHWLSVDFEERDVDTMILAMGTTEKGKQCGLKYLSRQHCNAPFYEEALDEWLTKDAICYGHIRPDILAEYGCKDVFYTFEIFPTLQKKVVEEGTQRLCSEFLMPAQRTLADIEYQGMTADIDYAKATSAAWEPKIASAVETVQEYARAKGFPLDPKLTDGQSYKSVCDCVPVRAQFHLEGLRVLSYAKCLREAGLVLDDCDKCNNKRYVTRLDTTLNVNSSVHMQHLCFDILGMKELPYAGRSCSKDFWKFNANHEFAKLVAEYKELLYLRRNFMEGVQKFIRPDGRVHPDFLLFGTKTGRLAIHDPAMQTVPQHGDNAKAAKRIFTADDEECVIVNADYKSLEMFVAHHLTEDPVLLGNLLGEWDVHTALAAKIYDKDPADVTPEERQSVKPVNFGAGYGISGFKLALDPAMELATGGDPDKAEEFLDAFWSMYSVWADKCDEWRALARDQQYLTTELGRKRRWTLITKDNKNKVNNQAINFSGQSLASDICLSALVRLHALLQAKGWGRVLLTVHDSLVFNIKKKYLHEAIELIEREMMTPPFETDTPFPVDIEVGPNYGEKEPYDREKVYL